MLKKLLNEIRRGGSFEINHLAEELGTTPGMVEAMLEHLVRTGLLHEYGECEDGCLGCNLKQDCVSEQGARGTRLWQSGKEKSPVGDWH